ncbi:hypothetical protein Mal65_02280 [Crateriforma conspicua]|nr:hypothetical protein Mal65_02280 [Crateriforma conspicua]
MPCTGAASTRFLMVGFLSPPGDGGRYPTDASNITLPIENPMRPNSDMSRRPDSPTARIRDAGQGRWAMLMVALIGMVLVVLGLIQALDTAGDSSILYRGWSTIVFGISIVILSHSTGRLIPNR